MAYQCTPVDLGLGTTPAHPCTTWAGVEVCTMFDTQRLLNVLLTERNALVVLLNRYNQMVGEGKVKWTAPVNAAWSLEEEAIGLYRGAPKTFMDWTTQSEWSHSQLASAVASMAQRVHAAYCDVAQALEQVGEPLPSQPVPPKEPEGWGDALVKAAKQGVETLGWVAGGAILVTLVYGWIQSRSGGGPRRR